MSAALDPPLLEPGIDVGHVPLKVAVLDRALAFCNSGFAIAGRLGDQAAFLSGAAETEAT
jgi:hypothetical protein